MDTTLNICTVCDSKYLLKALAMRQSLIDLGVKFVLHWLCIDKATYLVAQRLEGVTPILLYDLESKDSALLTASQSGYKSNYGDAYSNYVWALTPYFISHCLYHVPDYESLIYVDADIEFKAHPQIILDAVGDKPVGVHTHRFTPGRRKFDTGWYNIGVTVFKKNLTGQMISYIWKQLLLDKASPFQQEFGTCGDQKFFDLFVELFPHDIAIFDDGTNITHLAPWCCEEEKEKVLAFVHYSHFVYRDTYWEDSIKGEWHPTRHPHMKKLYEQYYQLLKRCCQL